MTAAEHLEAATRRADAQTALRYLTTRADELQTLPREQLRAIRGLTAALYVVTQFLEREANQ